MAHAPEYGALPDQRGEPIRRTKRRRPRGSLLLRLGILAAAVVVLLADPLLAAECRDVQLQPPPEFDFEVPEEQYDHIPTGAWFGTGSVSGSGSGVDEGLNLYWEGRFDLELDFVVEGNPGRLGGDWILTGFGRSQLQGTLDGQYVYVDANYDIDGEGRMDGDNSQIDLSGAGRNNGTAQVETDGYSGPQSVSTSYPLNELLKLEVRTANCQLAEGPMILTIAERGITIQLHGDWSAISLTEETRAEAERVLSELDSFGGDVDSSNPLVGSFGDLVERFRSHVRNLRSSSASDVIGLLTDLEGFLNTLQGLTPCQTRLFGAENLEQFATLATETIAQVIWSLGTSGAGFDEELDAEALQLITQIAVRTGAIGSGSTLGQIATDAENALRRHAERILKENIDPNDRRRFVVNDEVVSVTALATAMGWKFDIRGQEVSAGEIWAQIHDESGQKQASAMPPGLEGCEA